MELELNDHRFDKRKVKCCSDDKPMAQLEMYIKKHDTHVLSASKPSIMENGTLACDHVGVRTLRDHNRLP